MRTKSRRYQFTLRTLLLVVTVAAVGLSWYAVRRARTGRQEALLQPLAKQGGSIAYDGNGDVVEIWLPLYSSASDQELENLSYFVHLRRLELYGTDFTDAALANLEGLDKLEHLCVSLETPSGRKLTDAGLSHVGGLISLKSLRYTGARVSDVGLRHLEGLRNLELLVLSCPQATDQGLESLAKLDRLKSLGLFDSNKITGQGLEALPTPQILQALYIHRITDEGMGTISLFSNLSTLWIGGPDLTMQGLSRLRGLEKLEYLWIRETPLDTHALEQLATELPKLKELHLIRCPLREADLEPLRRLKQKGLTVSVEGADYDDKRNPNRFYYSTLRQFAL